MSGSSTSSLRRQSLQVVAERHSWGKLWPPAVVVTVVGIVVTVSLWMWLLRSEQTVLQVQTRAKAEGLAELLGASVTRNVQGLERMAARWRESGGTPEALWRADALGYVHDFDAFQAIEWVDESSTVRWVEPQKGNAAVAGLKLTFGPERRAALERVRATKQFSLTPVVDLAQGSKGFISYHSVTGQDGASGFVVGVFHLERLMVNVLSKFGDSFAVRIADAKGEFFSRGDWSAARQAADERHRLALFDQEWTLWLRPHNSLQASSKSPMPHVLLFLGCLMSAFVGLSMQFAHVAQYRAKNLRDVLEDLQNQTSRANHAAQAKAAFLATMSHEIRTPMNGVLGMAGLLAETSMQPAQAEMLQTIRSSGEALLLILDDILDFTKLEAGHVEVENKEFDLRVLVEEILDLVAAKAHAKALEVLCDLDPALPTMVLGDAGRIRQILLNLLGNAVKFTSVGHVALLVTPEPAQRVRFAVQDTGLGIEPYVLGQLFVPFKQADASTARRFGGTGLGLSISKRLAEAMGGSIGVRSQIGRGSTFELDLALPDRTKVDQQVVTRVEVVGVVASAEIGARGLAHQLADAGWTRVLQASSAAALMSLPGAGELAAIVFDDGMTHQPRVSTNGIPVIHLVDRRKAALANDTVLLKPVRRTRLSEALMNLLSKATTALPAVCRPVVENMTVAFGGRSVLVVEDTLVNQKVMRLTLTSLGCEVQVANDGVEALAAVAKQTFDIVFMDCQLPHMDGFEATRQIRAAEFDSRLPIVALTANAFPEDRAACLAAGMDEVLVKPADKSAIVGMLRRFVVKQAA